MKYQKKSLKKVVENKTKNAPPVAGFAKQPRWVLSPFYSSILITAIFFCVALFGMLHHEMWRDEHQAWLVAREAHSIPQLFQNIKYEGHPVLWHLLLYFITCFTHNVAYMQALHLLIACCFIYVFNRYATLDITCKILFSFGYFPIYEYAVISRCYGLEVLLVFIACALYRNRKSNYISLGITLALLANISIYGVIISLGIAGILALDQLFYQEKNREELRKLSIGLFIVLIGVAAAVLMIMPSKDNTFYLKSPGGIFEMGRWINDFAKLFTAYFNIPNTAAIHFWNTNYFYPNEYRIETPVRQLFEAHWSYVLLLIILPISTVFCSLLIFLRKPLILLLYAGITFGILCMFYYTNLLWIRYTGFLFIVLIICYWLAHFYEDKIYKNKLLKRLSDFGKKIQTPFLILALSTNVIGGIVAHYKDYKYEFSRANDVVDYIRDNKLESLPIAGCIDYLTCAVATYLDRQLYYPQMNDYGTFCIWNKKRNHRPLDSEVYSSIVNLMKKERKDKLLFLSTNLSYFSDGKTVTRGMLADDIKIDLLKYFEPGVVKGEQYYLFLVQRVDPNTVDLRQYPIAWDDPNGANYHVNKGEGYAKEGNYSGAIEEFEKAISINPNSIAAYIDLGAAFGSLKQYEDGIECLKKAESLDSANALTDYFFGVTYNKMGDSTKGKEYKTKAARLQREQHK